MGAERERDAERGERPEASSRSWPSVIDVRDAGEDGDVLTAVAPPVIGREGAAASVAGWLAHPPAVGYTCLAVDAWACVAVAPQLQGLLGISSEEWVRDADTWLDHTHPQDRERLLAERFRAVHDRRRFVLEYRLFDRCGNLRWVRDEAALEQRPDGEIVAHGMLLDLTDRHLSDRALSDRFERCLAELRDHRRELGERQAFVRLLAHDLRAPLSTIRGSLETVTGSGPDLPPAEHHELLERADRAAERGLELVHQLLEVDRWAASTMIDAAPVELASVVARACEEAGVAPDRIQTRVDVPTATIDAVVVIRAVTNLLNNADRYTPTGGRVRLRVVRVQPGVLRFSVEDEGPGVRDVDKERIFRPYLGLGEHRADSLGLGLSLVAVLAQLHGGQVWVEDLPEVGSVFHLEVREPG